MNAIFVAKKFVYTMLYEYMRLNNTLCVCTLCIEDDIVPLFRHPIFWLGFVSFFCCFSLLSWIYVCNVYAYIRLTVRLMVSLNQFYWNEFHQGNCNNP